MIPQKKNQMESLLNCLYDNTPSLFVVKFPYTWKILQIIPRSYTPASTVQ